MALAQRLSRVPLSKVELSISCKDLMNKDVTSKSDPCAVLHMQIGGKWTEMGRTENINNTLDPQFVKTFEIDYYFEEVQNIQVSIYDIDNATEKLSDDDFLGRIEASLGQVVSGSPFTRSLFGRDGKPVSRGMITIRSQEVSKINDVLNLNFIAQKLENKDTFGKSDPFLELSYQLPDNTWHVVHRTEVVKNNLNPIWQTVRIKAQKLSGGNYNAPIMMAVYDHDDGDDHDLIGHCTTSVPELISAMDKELSWPCINPKKQAKKKNYKDSGIVTLKNIQITKEYSFLDFIYGGMDIHFTVGIDFTASNGDPRDRKSLHFLNPQMPNEYQRAIHAVGCVVQDYDSDQQFPALGFGAKIPPNMDVSHEFAINFNSANPFCSGIGGVLQAYQACVPVIQLYGPTNFSPIINHVTQFALAAQRENTAKNYFILLIITDGVISDLHETIRAIVNASQLPMSIIIIGVGPADFTAMDILDGDGGLLKDNQGHVARRDIVQFVPFQKFSNVAPAELAKHVLAEVPRQVTDYYRLVNLPPCQGQGHGQGQGQVAGITQQMQKM